MHFLNILTSQIYTILEIMTFISNTPKAEAFMFINSVELLIERLYEIA